MDNKEAIRFLKQLYPHGGCCWLDEQRIEAISMAVEALAEKENAVVVDAKVAFDFSNPYDIYNRRLIVSLKDINEGLIKLKNTENVTDVKLIIVPTQHFSAHTTQQESNDSGSEKSDEWIVEQAREAEKRTQFGELVYSKLSKGVNSAYGIGFIEGMVAYRDSISEKD